MAMGPSYLVSTCGLLLLGTLFASTRGDVMVGEPDLSGYTYEQYLRELPGRILPDSSDVLEHRRQVFESNLELMRTHNADPDKTWFAAPNEFMDWTNEEFRSLRTSRVVGSGISLGDSTFESMDMDALPDSVDWRTKGVVTPVKNQVLPPRRGCAGCSRSWAFSAVETLESHLAIATGSEAPAVLSEQQVVSCAPNAQDCGGSGGYDGSTQPLAFNYTASVGLTLESDYPYRSSTGTCMKSKISPYATNEGYIKLPVNDYKSFVSAVATKGPLAISLAAGSMGWQLYGGGVFGGGRLGECDYGQDHGVQLVGYGSDKGSLYWLVRNSWGNGWGEKGYIRIKRHGDGSEPCGVDKTAGDGDACKGDTKPRTYCGVCGILGSTSYPTGVKMSPGKKNNSVSAAMPRSSVIVF